MPARLDVARRTAETAYQKIAQPLFGAYKILCRIHRTEDVVGGNLPVECRDEAFEAFFADRGVDLMFFQEPIITGAGGTSGKSVKPRVPRGATPGLQVEAIPDRAYKLPGIVVVRSRERTVAAEEEPPV